MERIFEQAMLYDFYGKLLNEHQRAVFEEYVLDNFSLSEIAQERGISKQGVHDTIKRTDKLLNDYEEKLHLVQKFLSIREKAHEIHTITSDLHEDKDLINQITIITNQIIDEL